MTEIVAQLSAISGDRFAQVEFMSDAPTFYNNNRGDVPEPLLGSLDEAWKHGSVIIDDVDLDFETLESNAVIEGCTVHITERNVWWTAFEKHSDDTWENYGLGHQPRRKLRRHLDGKRLLTPQEPHLRCGVHDHARG